MPPKGSDLILITGMMLPTGSSWIVAVLAS